LIEVLNIDT